MAYGFYQGFGFKDDDAPYYAGEMHDGDKGFIAPMPGPSSAIDFDDTLGSSWSTFRHLASDHGALNAAIEAQWRLAYMKAV